MNKYLIQFESDKNNIAGCALHIIKDSRIIFAKNMEEAKEKSFMADCGLYKYVLYHYGHDPDYQIITGISKLNMTIKEKIKYLFKT